jgi:prevent-host-death family protein
MKVTPVEMQTQFGAYVKACQEEPIAITQNGKIVAVLLSVEDEDELERLILNHSSQFQKILETSKRQIQEGKGIRHEDFWQEIE